MLVFLLLAVPATLAQSGERRSLIQDLVSKIRSSPSHNSLSPSFNGERKFDVIGVSLSHGFFFGWEISKYRPYVWNSNLIDLDFS